MTEPHYPEPVRQLIEAGLPADPWPDYPAQYGLTRAHIPELIRLVEDHDLRWGEPPAGFKEGDDLAEWYGQIHAWRALAQLKAEEAIPAVLGILHQVDDYDDDWLGEESYVVFPMFGPAAVAPLAAYLLDASNEDFARIAAGSSLEKMVGAYPDTQADCIAALVAALQRFDQNEESVNGLVIHSLVELKAVEHIALIEQVFKAGKADEMIRGDFEDIQVDLGLLAERQTPKRRPKVVDGLFRSPEPSPSEKKPPHKTDRDKKEKAKRKQEKLSRRKGRKKKKK